ncbi:unnamed protein product [Gongylonema pulchrum]|uniref:UBIQUITIN_CONJUGAT_2 domain-containing protein n=1 Tax=Gongylonema pulchrum TaxID=637853 RepID=A0A183EFN0_9BILA|nr:unnamed protein product [Gongylonema pulchrum]
MLRSSPPAGIIVEPCKSNLHRWNAVILGPENTPFEGGTFKMSLHFPLDYPYRPPIIKFDTRMFHPNVAADGRIALNELRNRWRPGLSMATILTSIRQLLDGPNTAITVNEQAADFYRTRRREFNIIARQAVEQSWRSLYEDERQQALGNENNSAKRSRTE